jgi:hypothetical protein
MSYDKLWKIMREGDPITANPAGFNNELDEVSYLYHGKLYNVTFERVETVPPGCLLYLSIPLSCSVSIPCPKCDGSGNLSEVTGLDIDCPDCDETGWIDDEGWELAPDSNQVASD